MSTKFKTVVTPHSVRFAIDGNGGYNIDTNGVQIGMWLILLGYQPGMMPETDIFPEMQRDMYRRHVPQKAIKSIQCINGEFVIELKDWFIYDEQQADILEYALRRQ